MLHKNGAFGHIRRSELIINVYVTTPLDRNGKLTVHRETKYENTEVERNQTAVKVIYASRGIK